MKPEKLIICGWGPYKEETVIDFSKLNTKGLFLVTGQTGAGKTTIFDAIAYALYGIMSGGMREKGSVRSDFADVDTKTYVELYMQHKKQMYHIVRNPEYQRPKKHKSGENAFTKEKEKAVLTMPDGTIIAGNQDVTDKIKELLQMDAKQFCQISMIAQGEFAKLLFAPPAEKNAIFRELFGTGMYERIQGELKKRSAVLYDNYKQYKNKMEEDVRILSLEDEEWLKLSEAENPDFGAIAEYLKKRLKEEEQTEQQIQKEEEVLEADLLLLQQEKEAAHQLNLRFAEAKQASVKVAELTEQSAWAEGLKEQIDYAQKLSVLALEEQVILEREKNVAEISKRNSRLTAELAEDEARAEALKTTVLHKEALQKAYELQNKLQELEERKQKTERQYAKIQSELLTARTEYEKAQDAAEEKSALYEQADVCYKKAVIGIAARLVKEGEPCPVCGSKEHPKVAEISGDIPDEKQLEKLKKEAETAKKKADELYAKALTLTNEEKQLQENRREIQAEKELLEQTLQKEGVFVLAYIKEHTKTAFEKECAGYLELETLISEKQKQIQQNESDLLQKQKELKKESDVFEKKVKDCGFSGREEYRLSAGRMKNPEMLKAQYEKYQNEFAAAKELLAHLQNRLEGKKPEDENALQEAFASKMAQRKERREMLDATRLLISRIKHSLEGISKNGERMDAIRAEYGIVKDLDDLANGNNARRLVFEQFVLAGYFEKILRAANLRLEKMTDGRYELLRARQVSDGRKKDNLEIMVMDYYTGRQRSVKTLSGGETFKASLALALGLSDCIQAENGGMEVETLFIDEGFGALDEESLDQACNTLMRLAGKDRMVGIISHVAQLREKIEHQIIVEKHNNGSRARVV